MDYAEILKKAWNIIWKHKILWLFGLLAGSAIGSGQGLSYRFSSQARIQQFWQNNRGFPSVFERVSEFYRSLPPFAWFLIAGAAVAAVLFISLILFFVREYGLAGVIKGSALADEPGRRGLKFSEVHRALKPYYWRLVLLRFLVVCAGAILAGLLAMPTIIFIIGTLGIGLCCLIPFFILLIPVGWGASVLVHNACIALVDENLGVVEALSRAWDVTIQNIGPLLVLHLLLGVVRLVTGLLMSIPMLAAALPLILALRSPGSAWPIAAGLLTGLLWLILLPLGLAGMSILNAFDLSARALAFREVKDKARVLPAGSQELPRQETN